MVNENDALRAECQRPREALARHGVHDPDCKTMLYETDECTCGYDDAFAALAGTPPQAEPPRVDAALRAEVERLREALQFLARKFGQPYVEQRDVDEMQCRIDAALADQPASPGGPCERCEALFGALREACDWLKRDTPDEVVAGINKALAQPSNETPEEP